MADAPTTASREERLAARLRENLKRRKAQARALASQAGGKHETSGAGGPDATTP